MRRGADRGAGKGGDRPAVAALIPNNASLFINIGTTTEAVGAGFARSSG
jgi:hypothetical protein